MAEEHGFQAPEGHRLCANNCGFFGSPATSNLCSKCYGDLRIKEEQGALAKAALENNSNSSLPSSPLSSSSSSSTKSATVSDIPIPSLNLPEPVAVDPRLSAVEEVVFQSQPPTAAAVQPKRCLTCRKRIGFTGFKCRCGSMFCGSHRYPESHGCTFDYKKMGKEAIAKANPVIKADKLEKIWIPFFLIWGIATSWIIWTSWFEFSLFVKFEFMDMKVCC